MKTVIIDYGMGNLKNVQKAFSYLGYETEISGEAKKIRQADKIILPGVGAFRDAIHMLKEKGLDEEVCRAVEKERYLLGICLGMHLLFEKSYENGEHEGLGLLSGEIVRFRADIQEKIPHMGWNSLDIKKEPPLFTHETGSPYVYFVHSYHVKTDADIVSATTFYGDEIPVAVQKGNMFALQFHPEKSGDYGLSILKNFGGLK